jgi:DNA-binding transcriptional ArsR family regulator
VTRGDADLSPELLQRAAGRFGLLASTMRLHIVWVLAHGEMDVGGLADAVGGTLQAVSQHLAKLKLAGLVRSRREGRRQPRNRHRRSRNGIGREPCHRNRQRQHGRAGRLDERSCR